MMSGSGRLALSSRLASLSQSRADGKRARQTGRSRDRLPPLVVIKALPAVEPVSNTMVAPPAPLTLPPSLIRVASPAVEVLRNVNSPSLLKVALPALELPAKTTAPLFVKEVKLPAVALFVKVICSRAGCEILHDPRIVSDAFAANRHRRRLVDECEWSRAGIEHDTVHLGIGCQEHVPYVGECERCGVSRPVGNSSRGPVRRRIPRPRARIRLPSGAPCESRGCCEEYEHANSLERPPPGQFWNSWRRGAEKDGFH